VSSFALSPGSGKAAFDALTDQPLAERGEQLACRHQDPDLCRLAADFAAMTAEQFPGDERLAARVLMAACQLLTALSERLEESAEVSVMTDIMALAAEQLSREGGAQ
jgi:hypothetical protein